MPSLAGETTLTHDIVSKLVLSDVVKQGGEHRQEGDGGVVDVLGHAFHLLDVTEKRERRYMIMGSV